MYLRPHSLILLLLCFMSGCDSRQVQEPTPVQESLDSSPSSVADAASSGAPVYNLFELKGTARKVDIPEPRASALLFGLVGLMGAMQRRRRA